MVKKLTVLYLSALVVCALCVSGCNIDFLGFAVANDLDERLLDKNNFVFLSADKVDKQGNKRTDVPNNRTNRGSELFLDTPSEYKFIVLTDTHIEGDKAYGFEKMNSVIEAEEAKFVVVTGDITQNGAAIDIERFSEIADSFNVPCYPVIGNHDVYFSSWPVWKTMIGSTNYRIDNKDSEHTTTLLFLDSANSFFGKKQLDWLEEQLKKDVGENVFVFTHAPLFIKGPVKMQQITDHKERSRIISILKGKCDIMFMGHSHQRVENTVGNVNYVTAEDFINNQVYVVVTVKSSGITYKFGNL